jgi:hypothetical protein
MIKVHYIYIYIYIYENRIMKHTKKPFKRREEGKWIRWHNGREVNLIKVHHIHI